MPGAWSASDEYAWLDSWHDGQFRQQHARDPGCHHRTCTGCDCVSRAALGDGRRDERAASQLADLYSRDTAADERAG